MERRDAAAVSVLHQQLLRTNLKGRFGQRLLECYYNVLPSGKGAAAYVAVSPEEDILGFVCGIWDASSLRSMLLQKKALPILFWGTLHILRDVRQVHDLCGRLAGGLRKRSEPHVISSGSEYELRPIVIAAAAQGKGIAGRLLSRLIQDAGERGVQALTLKTECDNGRANAFYRKHGFVLDRVVGDYNVYSLAITGEQSAQ